MISQDIPRRSGVLHELSTFLDKHLAAGSVDGDTTFRVQLAAEEIFRNMVEHNEGGGELITVGIGVSREEIRLQLIDRDVEPFDPRSVSSVDLSEKLAEGARGGLGLHLVKSVVDCVTYSYKGRQMKVTLVQHRDG